MDFSEAAESVQDGGIGVLPTDTLYGVVGSALDPDAVDRIYELKRRDHRKPLIVLISDIEMVEQFGVELSDTLRARLVMYWPGPVSIVLPIIDDQFEYLSRGTDTIAFRLPKDDSLCDLIRMVGPLVAPSANMEGMPPATNVEEAKRYFGTDVDFYVDGGPCEGPASRLIRLDGEEEEVLRDE